MEKWSAPLKQLRQDQEPDSSESLPSILVDPCLVLSAAGIQATARIMSVPPFEIDIHLAGDGSEISIEGLSKSALLETLGEQWQTALISGVGAALDRRLRFVLDTRGTVKRSRTRVGSLDVPAGDGRDMLGLFHSTFGWSLGLGLV